MTDAKKSQDTKIVTKPNLVVKNGETQQTIFMSFALLNRLVRHMGSVDDLPQLAVNPELQETIMLEVFTRRAKTGEVEFAPASLDELEVSLDDMELVLEFVGDHIASFFMRAAENMQERMLKLQARTTAISNSMPTKNGS